MKTLSKILPPRKNLLTLGITLCAASAVHGQILSTGTFTGDTFLTLAGPVSSEVYGVATNVSSATITTANGYSFLGAASAAGQADLTIPRGANTDPTGDVGSFSGFSNGTTTGDTGLDSVINTSLYGHPLTYTLKNLTVGDVYTVLVFASDDRGPGSTGDRTFSLTDGGVTSNAQQFVFPNGAGGAGMTTEGGYLLDTFTATAPSHDITVNNEQEGQGVLVEEVVPEPSTYALLFGGLGALMLGVRLRRRANPL